VDSEKRVEVNANLAAARKEYQDAVVQYELAGQLLEQLGPGHGASISA
jgi:hypothetical protein